MKLWAYLKLLKLNYGGGGGRVKLFQTYLACLKALINWRLAYDVILQLFWTYAHIRDNQGFIQHISATGNLLQLNIFWVNFKKMSK